jgi:PBP1b-binding outer membrane lipoprotein LpoB
MCTAITKDIFMQFGKLKLLVSVLALALALIGCSPTPETVGEMARTSIQDVLKVDPRFQGTGVEVVRVQLAVDGDKQYKGIASIRHKGVVHEIPVNVVVDGLSIKWSTAPDAFSFIPQTRPPL